MFSKSIFFHSRPTKGVLGLTRERLSSLRLQILKVENGEDERIETQLEHPRASTTDDVECIFSIMRDMVGNHFTLQCVKYNWRKVCNEFMKRLDPSLPFYYHTSTHDRFYEGAQRLHAVEQMSRMQGRVTLPAPGPRSIRSTYHNKPIDHPPPPSGVNPLSEHNYR